MEIFDVLSMNGIVNYPAVGEFFLENVILKVSQTHFSKDFCPKGGHKFFTGAVKYPVGEIAIFWPRLGKAFPQRQELTDQESRSTPDLNS